MINFRRIVNSLPDWDWLRRASGYTLKTGWPLLLAELVSEMAGLFTVFAFTRWSDPQTYGGYKYITTILATLAIFSMPGVNNAITQAVASGARGILLTAIRFRATWSLLGSASACGVAGWLAWRGQITLVPAMLLGAAIFPACFSSDTVLSFLNGKLAYNRLASLKAFSSLAGSLSQCLLIIYMPSSIPPLVIGALLTPALVMIAGTILTLSQYPEEKTPTAHQEHIRFGTQLTWRGFIGTVENRLDLLLVGTFFPLEQLAIFSVGKLFRDILARAWGLFGTLLLPKLSSKTGISRSLTTKLLLSLGGTFLLLVLAIIITAPTFIPAIFSKAYSGSIFYAQAFAGLTAIGIIGAILESQFTSQRLIRPLFIVRITTSSAYIIGLATFMPAFGINGIVFALYLRAIVYSLSCVILWIRGIK